MLNPQFRQISNTTTVHLSLRKMKARESCASAKHAIQMQFILVFLLGGKMNSIHGHEVLNMMMASGEQYSLESLEAAIHERFGTQARFHTCSAENMSAGELVDFLHKKGKFIPLESGFTTAESKICRH